MTGSLLPKISQPAGLLLGLLWLAGCARPPAGHPASLEAAECCQSYYPAATFKQCTTRQLGQEYRRLRQLHCRACNRYGGDFHRIMEELGTRLDGQPRATIRRTMGRPDQARDSTLVYYWRYTHDYLRFRLAADGTAVSSWYFALE